MQKGNLDQVVYIQHTLSMLWYMQKKKTLPFIIFHVLCHVCIHTDPKYIINIVKEKKQNTTAI